VAAANQRPELAGVTTSYSASVPQIRIDLDREKAKCSASTSPRFSTPCRAPSRAVRERLQPRRPRVRVHLQSEAEFRRSAEDIRNVYVRTGSGELIRSRRSSHPRGDGPRVIERYNVFPSAKVLGGPRPATARAGARLMEEVARRRC